MEKWKPIPGHEGRYEVSDQGRVRSLSRWARVRGGGERFVSSRILSLTRGTGRGGNRMMVMLNNGVKGGGRPAKVARLVAEAFLGALPGDKVHRIDQDEENNAASNLWVERTQALEESVSKV